MAIITQSYDSKNPSNEFSEKTLTKEEKQLKKAFANAIILKEKIERGEIEGTSDVEGLLNEKFCSLEL
jgi:hypothetical protein